SIAVRRQGMKGDFTRDTFLAANHFSRVLLQQGRVQLDADVNEQTAILLHYLRRMTADMMGSHGGPCGEGCAFELTWAQNTDHRDFAIGSGHYYVDGILIEVDEEVKYSDHAVANGFPVLTRD